MFRASEFTRTEKLFVGTVVGLLLVICGCVGFFTYVFKSSATPVASFDTSTAPAGSPEPTDAAASPSTPAVAASTLPPSTTPTPMPSTASPTPRPRPTVSGAVRPDGMCKQHYYFGFTKDGVRMQCTTTPNDSRFRWRPA